MYTIAINGLIWLCLGLGIGFAVGMTGISAVLVLPCLIYIVGLSPVNAIGTGLLYSMLARSYGVYEHLKLRTIRKRTALYIVIGGVPAVLITSIIITHLAKTPELFNTDLEYQASLDEGCISETLKKHFENNGILLSSDTIIQIDKKGSRWLVKDKKNYEIRKDKDKLSVHPGSNLNSVLKTIMSVVILFTWLLMVINIIRSHKNKKDSYYKPPKHFPRRRKLYGIAAGSGVGVLIGATSMGAGVLIVPILVSIFQLSPNNTVGTSVLVGITMSAAGSFIYLLSGSAIIPVAVIMFIGSIPGIYLGARVSVKVPHRTLSIILLAVITMSVILMFAGGRH